MTIYDAVFSAWRQPMLGVLFLILTGWMTLLVAARRDGRSRRVRSVMLAFLLFSGLLLWLCLCLIAWENNTSGGFAALPARLAAFGALPAWAAAAAEAFLAVPLIPAALDIRRYRDGHLTQDSIKETMDLLPVGVAYAGPDGGVVFRNLVMERLSLLLTGSMLTDMDRFLGSAGDGPLSLEDRVWQLDSRARPDGTLTEYTATDITEQAGILKDLQEKNRKLRDIQLRLKIYDRQAERIIIAQELLTARMTVHDELGSVLLESRHYMNDPASIDEELLLRALRNANTYLLREYEGDDTAVDPLTEAVGMARAIGVKVELTGVPPAEDDPREILAAAVRECAANCVKHAEGDRLQVDARRTEDGYAFTLCGNGRPPSAPVRETGGLLSLRTLVENRRGVMRAEASDAFRVVIELPPPGSSPGQTQNRPDGR